MNRRRFIELLGLATAGSTIAYSFPSIVVPKNLIVALPDAIKPFWAVSKPGYNLAWTSQAQQIAPHYFDYSVEFLRTMAEMTSHVVDFSNQL